MKPFSKGDFGYQRKQVIKEATVKDFSGGLDLSDDDLNIDSQSAKVLTNMYRSRDGRLRLRYGVQQVVDASALLTGNIIALQYFSGCMIAATDQGEIAAFPVNGAGTNVKLWPTGAAGKNWTPPVSQVNFAQAQGQMLIVNGKDKPLRLKGDFSIDFLGDAGNGGSNVNTPIAPYIVTCDNYVVMAGQPSFPSKLFISAKGSTGTFSGDPAPNDATTFDVGGSIAHGDNIIVGLAALNNYLFVAFETSTVVVQLGEYNGDNTAHIPTIFDVYDTYGAISQKTMGIVDKELWYSDQSGVLNIQRNQLGTSFIPNRVSTKIDPQLLKHLSAARTLGQIRNCFAVYNRIASQYMIFVPADSALNRHCWVSTRYDPTDEPSWALFEGMNYSCGDVSSIGKLYLCTSKRMYLYGDINNEVFSDNGASISFDWEMPWSVFSTYDQIKKMKAIRVYTRGTASFTLQLFVDGLYKKPDGITYDPAAQIDFVAADVGGFGNETGNDPYGGGRSAGDPRIWKFDGKFIQGKFRVSGSATTDIQIVGMSITYTVGGRKR
jgi:hypothetical protein